MDYDTLFEVIHSTLVKRGIESHRIAGDLTRAVMRAVQPQPASPDALAGETDAADGGVCAECGAQLRDGHCRNPDCSEFQPARR